MDMWRLHNGRAVRGATPAVKGAGVNNRLDAGHLFASGSAAYGRMAGNRGRRYARPQS